MFVIIIVNKIILTLIFCGVCFGNNSYKPVVLLHGILSGFENMIFLQSEIELASTETYKRKLDVITTLSFNSKLTLH